LVDLHAKRDLMHEFVHAGTALAEKEFAILGFFYQE
jgi:hypothetical protein